MENRIRESFHLIWLIAIVLCAVVAVFALIFASCSRGGGDDWSDLPAASSTVTEVPAEPAAATFAPEVTLTPEPAATPEPTAEPEETPVPEPQG